MSEIEFKKPVPFQGHAIELNDRVVVGGKEYHVTDQIYNSDVSGSRVFRAVNMDDPDDCIVLKDARKESTDDLSHVIRIREALPIGTDHLSKYHAFKKYSDDRVVIAASFADGISLDRLDVGPPYSRENVLNTVYLTRGLISAVGKIMETGALHRDIKARNSIFLRNGGVGIIDIDFLTLLRDEEERIRWEEAQAKAKKEKRKLKLFSVGTPENMSPESVVGNFTNTSDIYSLGIVSLKQMMGEPIEEDPINKEIGNPFGRMKKDYKQALREKVLGKFLPPDFEGIMMRRVLPNYPESVQQKARGLIRFILKATQHESGSRPQSGEEALRLLDSD